MARLFGRRFFRVPRRIVIHGVAGPVETPAPGALERKPPPAIPREPARRQVKPLPLLGVRQPRLLIPIAKMLMERHRKIMRFRLAQKPIPTVPIPVVVGATPISFRLPAAARLMLQRPARQIPVPGVAALAAVGATPAKLMSPAVARPMPQRPARPIPVSGIVVVAAVGAIPVRLRRPTIQRPAFRRVMARAIFTAEGALFVIVCTDGVWSATISFLPCDDLRITIDGPAADDVKIAATMELQE